MAAVATTPVGGDVQVKFDLLSKQREDDASAFEKERSVLEQQLKDAERELLEAAEKSSTSSESGAMSEKEVEKLKADLAKLQDEKKAAEAQMQTMASLVANAEKDAKRIQESKSLLRLETECAKVESAKLEMLEKLEREKSGVKEKQEALSGEARSLEQKRDAASGAFQEKLRAFVAQSAQEKEQAEAQLEELREEHELLNRASEDTSFLQKELARVKVESERKIAQLQELKLNEILDELQKTKQSETAAVQLLTAEVARMEKEVADAEALHERIVKEHGEVSRSYGSKKDEILAEIERSREVAKEAEVKVKELKEKIQRLEDDSWQMNTKYAEKMEKTLAKKAANGKNQAESDMKRYRSELEKEKSAHGPLNAKIAALEKELKAEKKRREKVEKEQQQGQGKKKKQSSSLSVVGGSPGLATKHKQEQDATQYAELAARYEDNPNSAHKNSESWIMKKLKHTLKKDKPLVVALSFVVIACCFVGLEFDSIVARR
eukprot:g4462.t1